MPKRVQARAAQDEKEEGQLRKIATSRHGPADWIMQARMVVYSWEGMRVDAIARALQCCEKSVRLHLKRFNEQGLDGLGDRPRPGRHGRLTETERSLIIAFAYETAPGSLHREADGSLQARDEQASAQWSLDALTQAAHQAGIQVERSQIRRIFLREGVRWRRTHSWGTSDDKDARPKRTAVVTLYIQPPVGATTVCTDELGPVTPRTFAPAPGWSATGHRIKAPLEYSRDPEKVWIYGALRVRDGHAWTRSASSRNSVNYIQMLQDIEAANPSGEVYIITDNLSSHNSLATRTWLLDHPRLHQVFIPKGACWLNLQEGWWRFYRRDALAGQTFADAQEIERATIVATAQLNRRAKPWVWGRPPKTPRHRRRLFCYRI